MLTLCGTHIAPVLPGCQTFSRDAETQSVHMIRSIAFLAALATLGSAGAAIAQIDPDDYGLGTKLGLAQRNNSGQPGTVTLFEHGAQQTIVVLHVFSEPDGRRETAHIHRGHSCDGLGPRPVYDLAPVVRSISRTLVAASVARLLSGNYAVDVHARGNASRSVACGELYH